MARFSPCSLSETESQQVRNCSGKVAAPMRLTVHFLDQVTGVPGTGDLLAQHFTQQGLWNSRLFYLQLIPVSLPIP